MGLPGTSVPPPGPRDLYDEPMARVAQALQVGAAGAAGSVKRLAKEPQGKSGQEAEVVSMGSFGVRSDGLAPSVWRSVGHRPWAHCLNSVW